MVGLMPTGDPLVTALDTMITGYGYTTQLYATEADFEAFIRSTTYETGTKLCFGIAVLSSTLGGNYQYKLRFNISINRQRTDGPATTLDLTEERGIDLTMYSR